MVMEERQTSTSSTTISSVSVTQCPGDDGPSSVGLDSAGQVSTDSNTSSTVSVEARAGRESTDLNTSSVVPTGAGTHVMYGCETLTVTH